ncbi:hypothetical protein GCM10022396_35870 [Flavivirga amylovorans]
MDKGYKKEGFETFKIKESVETSLENIAREFLNHIQLLSEMFFLFNFFVRCCFLARYKSGLCTFKV